MALSLETVRVAMEDLRTAGKKTGVGDIIEITGGNRAKVAEYRRTVLAEWEKGVPATKVKSNTEIAVEFLNKLFGEITPLDEMDDPEKALHAQAIYAFTTSKRIEEELTDALKKAESKIARLEEHKVTWKDHSTLVVGLNQPEPHTEGTTLVTPPRATLTVYLDEEFGTPHSAEWKANCHLLNETINIEATKALCKHLKEHATYKHDYALQLLVERVTKAHGA